MTGGAAQPHVVTSLAELVQEITVELVGITFYKASAEISGDYVSDDPQIGDLEPKFALKLIAENDEIGVRLNLTLKGEIGTVEVDVAANYETPFPVEVPEEVSVEFANEVGIMVLLPYVRETVWSLTQRVFGTAMVMPVFQRGQVSFSPADRS